VLAAPRRPPPLPPVEHPPLAHRQALAARRGQVTSRSSGETYYKNAATGETRWDLPTADVASEAAAATALDAAAERATSPQRTGAAAAPGGAAEAEVGSALPAGWLAVESSQGDTYYRNEASGTTQVRAFVGIVFQHGWVWGRRGWMHVVSWNAPRRQGNAGWHP
jgi:hypothetical protein